MDYYEASPTRRRRTGDPPPRRHNRVEWAERRRRLLRAWARQPGLLRERVIRQTRASTSAVIAGDLHRYAYQQVDLMEVGAAQKTGLAKRGAFLHPTHDLPKLRRWSRWIPTTPGASRRTAEARYPKPRRSRCRRSSRLSLPAATRASRARPGVAHAQTVVRPAEPRNGQSASPTLGCSAVVTWMAAGRRVPATSLSPSRWSQQWAPVRACPHATTGVPTSYQVRGQGCSRRPPRGSWPIIWRGVAAVAIADVVRRRMAGEIVSAAAVLGAVAKSPWSAPTRLRPSRSCNYAYANEALAAARLTATRTSCDSTQEDGRTIYAIGVRRSVKAAAAGGRPRRGRRLRVVDRAGHYGPCTAPDRDGPPAYPAGRAALIRRGQGHEALASTATAAARSPTPSFR